MGLTLDLTRFPLVVWRLAAGADSREQLECQCAAHLQELMRHRGMFVCVHDWSEADGLEAPAVSVCIDALLGPVLSARCVGQAVVVSSPSLRGMVLASTAHRVAASPLRVTHSLDVARGWARSRLRLSEPWTRQGRCA